MVIGHSRPAVRGRATLRNCELTRVYCQCIDRHIAKRGDKVAIIYEGDEPGAGQHITYRALLREVCRVAASLREMVRTRACLVARASSHPQMCVVWVGLGAAGGAKGRRRLHLSAHDPSTGVYDPRVRAGGRALLTGIFRRRRRAALLCWPPSHPLDWPLVVVVYIISCAYNFVVCGTAARGSARLTPSSSRDSLLRRCGCVRPQPLLPHLRASVAVRARR